jgi:2-C-methyl-D-erythritol 2,4-cyclodiphosphate synthase
VGIGHDTHRLVAGRPLVLGGIRIEHERGLLGHSDADVVLHAVADALLGAAALGDIGELFPDTDPQWEGLDGARLLTEVRRRVAGAGWSPMNCDLIIHAQQPKLSAHKPALRASVARLLGLGEDAVNIKAKTGEHVGPIGRGEAIACEAIVMIEARDQGPGTRDQ